MIAPINLLQFQLIHGVVIIPKRILLCVQQQSILIILQVAAYGKSFVEAAKATKEIIKTSGIGEAGTVVVCVI